MRALPLVILIGGAACGADSIVCTAESRPALIVFVQDSVSGLPLNAGTTVIARDGAYRDSVTNFVADSAYNTAGIFLANNRSGTYLITVRRAGYAEWQGVAVATASSACGPIATEVVARLQPQ